MQNDHISAKIWMPIVIIAAAIVGYLVWSRSRPIEPVQTQLPTTADETRDWKTYRNDEYGFGFKYPKSLDTSVSSSAGKPENFFTFEKRFVSITIGTSEYFQILKRMQDAGPPPIFLSIGVHEPKQAPNLGTNGCGPEWQFVKSVVIDAFTASQCEQKGTSSNPVSMSIFFTRNGTLYYDFWSDVYAGQDQITIDKIISTFKFTK